jgi:hypothetical protein
MTLQEYREFWHSNLRYHWKRFLKRPTWSDGFHILRVLWWAKRPRWFIPNHKGGA